METIRLRPGMLFGVATLATAGFVVLARAVAQGKTARFDRRAKRGVHAARSGDGRERALALASRSTTPLGKWWAHVPAAFTTARKLRADGRDAAAFTIAGTSVVAALLPVVLDRITARRLPPPERHQPNKQSYPSGHALQTSAMAIATGYVLHREEVATSAWLPLGSLSLATGLGRLLLDRHWTSDLLGGYFAGVALGAASCGCYELARARA
jgi:undecaprenyl-diphosphatase